MFLILNVEAEIIERIVSYLGWRHLGIVYPMFIALAPCHVPRLTSLVLRRCFNDTLNRFSTFRPEFLNEERIRLAVSESPRILLLHFYDIFRIYKKPTRFVRTIDNYYSLFDTTGARTHLYNTGRATRKVTQIVFHPTLPIVALAFLDTSGASFGVYAYAGLARAKKAFVIYHHRGGMGSCRHPCRCHSSHHFLQISWSLGGSKLCCLETTLHARATFINTVVAKFFVLNPDTFDMRRVKANINEDVTLELSTFGWHKLYNITLWASDDDFYYPEFWENRQGFVIRRVNITYDPTTNNVTLTYFPTGIATSFDGRRPNLFAYPPNILDRNTPRYCNPLGVCLRDSDAEHAAFAIPYGFWLINNGKVLFTCDDCPNRLHIPHSILRRQAVLLPADTFHPTSGIVFKHHRINDAAPLSTDPAYLLLLLTCDAMHHQPFCSTSADCINDWKGSRYEPLQPSTYNLNALKPSNALPCPWGSNRPPCDDIINIDRVIYVYLGIIKGESESDQFEQIAMATIDARNDTGHQYQLQIFAQTKNYVLIRECCNHSRSRNIQRACTDHGPARIFLFSKLLNQCLELAVNEYYPHPKKDLHLYFNFRSHETVHSHSIVVLKSGIEAEDPSEYETLEKERFEAFETPSHTCRPCPSCTFHNYVHDCEFNTPLRPVRIDKT